MIATLELELDARLYTAEAVIRAVHRQSSDCNVELDRIRDTYRVSMTPRVERGNDGLRARFLNDLVDEQLRESVAAQTSDLQKSLVEAALREARPR